MPLYHHSPISMKQLDQNIDDDLVFNTKYSAIRRESDLGTLTIMGGNDVDSGGDIKLFGSNGGGALGANIRAIIGHEDGLGGMKGVIEINNFYGTYSYLHIHGRVYLSDFIDMQNCLIKGLATPTADTDAATKAYVDTAETDAVTVANGYTDTEISDLLDAALNFNGNVIYRGDDNIGYILLRGGANAAGKGGRVIVHGVDASTYTGGFRVTVPNSTSNGEVECITIVGKTDAPEISFNSRELKSIKNMGATSVADGGTISHGLNGTPTAVVATASVANEIVAVTAKGATTFTVAIKKRADGSAGTTQTIYWWAVR